MINQFEEYIKTNKLCNPNDKILVAVSGGIDSMVMLDLFIKKDYNTGIAHCNFCLRDSESDGDEQFVREFAEKMRLPFYSVSFNTREYAAGKSLSIQMAARELRYEWLYRIACENDYTNIAVGHNSDDSIETFFINLTRNSGIHGLTGIKPKNNRIIRPVLFASRSQIAAYAKKNNIRYREDSSNAETKYLRNKLRHKIIPEIEKINPSFRENIHEVIKRMKEAEDILADVTEQYRKSAVSETGSTAYIDIDKLPSRDTAHTILYELIKRYGFNSSQVKNIAKSFDTQPGIQFFSHSHRLIKDRRHLIITPLNIISDLQILIEPGMNNLDYPIRLRFENLNNHADFVIPRSNRTVALDADKLKFPLKLRKWIKGDRFMPFGMQHFKKLSDFFIDNKLSLSDKEQVWIIESEDKIVWVVNHRIDNRFRINDSTRNLLIIDSNY